MLKNNDGVFLRTDCPGYYITWTDAQGRRRKRKTNAQTLVQAREARAAELLKVEKEKALGFSPPTGDLFKDIANRFLKHQQARLTPKSYERERGVVNQHLIPFFTGKLAAIRRIEVQQYATRRSAEVSAASVIKELNALKHLFHLAVEWDLIPFSPCDRIKLPKAPAGRVRYLQPTELKTLLEASPEWLRPVIAIAVSTGMRRSEILGLRWLDLDLLNRRALLPQTKNGDGRVVYLNKFAMAALQSLRNGNIPLTTGRVFASFSPEQVSVAFMRTCRQAKIQDFHFHDLRHTAASWLRMQGADIHTVAQILGHKDLRMAARYQHLSPQFLSKAVNKLDALLTLPKQIAETGSDAKFEPLRPVRVPTEKESSDSVSLTQ